MITLGHCLLALIVFLIGLRLSAFFSGSETGFYRVSHLRLNFDAQQNDPSAKRLLWFAQNPSYFVATTLVGNNVANYVTTFALGMMAAAMMPGGTGWLEIVLTLLCAPIVFIFGELIPKNLYYRAPMRLLRRGVLPFQWCFRLFIPVVFPLILITKLLEKLSGSSQRPVELMLGRSRLVQVLNQGHREGILADVQGRLAQGVLNIAEQTVLDSMTPTNRVNGVLDTATREEIFECAQRFGTAVVAVSKPDRPQQWYGYVLLAEVALDNRSLSALITEMPVIQQSANKLETLLSLRKAQKEAGVVTNNQGDVLGIVYENGLIEQLFRRSGQMTPAKLSD